MSLPKSLLVHTQKILLHRHCESKAKQSLKIIVCLALIVFMGCENHKPSSAVAPTSVASSQNTKNTGPDYEKLEKESAGLKNEHAKLQKDFQAITMDRDNLINQAKLLLSDRARANDLSEALEKIKNEKELVENEKEEIIDKNLKLGEEIQKLEAAYGQIKNEKQQLEDLLSKERDKNQVRKLGQEKADLQKENGELKAALKQAQGELSRGKDVSAKTSSEFKNAKEEIAKLRQKIDSLNQGYVEALKKNKALEQKALNAPDKFAELARQNKTLIKQTANMHYNLGVFYTKSKEYSRAIAEFEEAVKLRPDDAYSHFNLGYIYAEYILNRPKAIEHFRHYLRLAKSEDKDMDWVKKYILTWQSWAGKEPME